MLKVKRQKNALTITLNHEAREISIKDDYFLKSIIKNGKEVTKEIITPKFERVLVRNPYSGDSCELDKMGYVLFSIALSSHQENWNLYDSLGWTHSKSMRQKMEEASNAYHLYSHIFRLLYPSEYMTLLD